MVLGAFVAVSGDIKFDLPGYTFIFINNISTAGKGILTKSRLTKHKFSSTTLLFYNSLFMFPLLLLIVFFAENMQPVMAFPLWQSPPFVFGFLFSCLAAIILQFLTFECTRITSALTTSVMGVMKNTVVTYGGMFVGGDYVYTFISFLGVTISTLGAVIYGFAMYNSKQIGMKPILPSSKL